jgi:hypothetical protein
MTEIEKPRDLYAALVLGAVHARSGLMLGLRPMGLAVRMLVWERRRVETRTALLATTGAPTFMWALARILGVAMALSGLQSLLWYLLYNVAMGDEASSWTMGATLGASGLGFQYLFRILANLTSPWLWLGLAIAWSIRQFAGRGYWLGEIKVLPISMDTHARRIVAVALLNTVWAYLALFVLSRMMIVLYEWWGGGFRDYLPMLLLQGAGYENMQQPRLWEILLIEPIAHLRSGLWTVTFLLLAVTLGLHFRHVLVAAAAAAVASWGLVHSVMFLRAVSVDHLKALVSGLVPGDRLNLAAHQLFSLCVAVGLLFVVGVLCSWLQRQVTRLLEE